MDSQGAPETLSAISTAWGLIFKSQGGADEQARQARNQFAERYQGAIRRCLHRYLPTRPDVAEAIASDVIGELLEGKGVLRHAGERPGCTERPGSFRAYLKQALR